LGVALEKSASGEGEKRKGVRKNKRRGKKAELFRTDARTPMRSEGGWQALAAWDTQENGGCSTLRGSPPT